jgi:ABC-2 type transport system permease protein
MMRAFRSEFLKFRRWSMLAGSGVMIASTAFIAYLTFRQITSGATGPELTPLIQAFATAQGLITVVGQARSLIIVIALIMVTSNLAAEWSQGTLRNLLAFFGNEMLCLVGISLLGMLIAVFTRSVGAAVGVALAYVLVPEGIIAMVWQQGSQWFPVRVLNFLPGSAFPPAVGPTPPQGYLTALGVALLWMIVFVVVSALVFRRQDVNA